MSNDASNFISSRKRKTALSFQKIKEILWYISECYTIFQLDEIIYSKKWCSINTSSKFEDYLKMEFVDNYLIKQKKLIQNKLSILEQINFSYETEKRFTDLDGIERLDKIDIYINNLGLQNIWKDSNEHVYFAIECKRINKLSDCKNYIGDIKKFCVRKYKQTRLPFEGMIAFLEKEKLSHQIVSENINLKLKDDTAINTTKYLEGLRVNSSFDGSYQSSHSKEYNKSEIFFIYHLLFDYSKSIIN